MKNMIKLSICKVSIIFKYKKITLLSIFFLLNFLRLSFTFGQQKLTKIKIDNRIIIG